MQELGHARHDGGDRRRLGLALLLAAATALLEVWGGLWSGSLALIADAAHVIADAGALMLALAAVIVSSRPHTRRLTFGFHRAEVLAAALNGLGLLVLAGFLAWSAIGRLREPRDVEAGGLLLVAGAGLLANLLAAWLLGHSHSLNVRAARLHVLSDLGGSVAAVTAGVVVALTGWNRADPLLSLLILALVAIAAVRVLREAGLVLMDATPPGVDLREVERALLSLPGVTGAHDLHCWTVTPGFNAFAAHLDLEPHADPATVVAGGTHLLRERFGIAHATLQPDVPVLHEPSVER